MKYLSLFLTFIAFNVFAQKVAPFRIDSLPKQGILLDKGWKFHAGDNADFAKVDFDDSQWQSINPTVDIFDLPQLPKAGQIFWLRLHLAVDSLLNQQMVMMIQQSGASEIYLNGKLIHRLGIVSTVADEIKAYNPQEQLYSFPIQKTSSQILAVRYAFQPTMRYATHFANSNKALSIALFSPENWYKQNAFKQYGHDLSVVTGSIYLALFLLYFALYLFFPKRKINLYFAVYTFLYSIPYFSSGFIHNLDIGTSYWVFNTLIILSVVGSSFLLLAVYRLFESKIGVFYWTILIFGLISSLLAFLFYGWGWTVYGGGYNLLVSFEILRTAIKGIIKHKKGAWIIATGGFVFFFFWFSFLIGINVLGTHYAPYFYVIAQLGIPLSVAIFLGYDFAQTNLSLQQKLIENEALSAEKQQILATQNETLERQVAERTAELKASQNQLIQKEKLASLGELTAGIAHEIQNPLNFVNNFSELSVDLAKDLKQEIERPDQDKEYITELLTDLSSNQAKINHHGKRASSIVSGMLEHSRSSTGERVMTDLNKLADEYLRLSYHGMRAKNSSFNADYELIADESLPLINVVPQDIGRVLLNLINNAFYAVHQRNNVETLHATSLPATYQPTVIVSTQHINNQIIIRVKDNGNGIPADILPKIFQPFFTTKPAGEGTGLGLSLSYDIVTKGHNGTIEVESIEGEGTTFTVKLPFKNS